MPVPAPSNDNPGIIASQRVKASRLSIKSYLNDGTLSVLDNDRPPRVIAGSDVHFGITFYDPNTGAPTIVSSVTLSIKREGSAFQDDAIMVLNTLTNQYEAVMTPSLAGTYFIRVAVPLPVNYVDESSFYVAGSRF